MEFEWDSILIFIALLAGVLPLLIPRLKKAWKWYHKMQSGSEDLSKHVARVEKEFQGGPTREEIETRIFHYNPGISMEKLKELVEKEFQGKGENNETRDNS